MTQLYKNSRDGWTAETMLEMENGRALKILTMKRDGGEIITDCRAVKLTEKGFSFTFGQDYRSTLIRSKNRCTQKNVGDQHMAAVMNATQLVATAEAFYRH